MELLIISMRRYINILLSLVALYAVCSHEVTWIIAKESEAVKRNWLRRLACQQFTPFNVSENIPKSIPQAGCGQQGSRSSSHSIPRKRSSEWDPVCGEQGHQPQVPSLSRLGTGLCNSVIITGAFCQRGRLRQIVSGCVDPHSLSVLIGAWFMGRRSAGRCDLDAGTLWIKWAHKLGS